MIHPQIIDSIAERTCILYTHQVDITPSSEVPNYKTPWCSRGSESSVFIVYTWLMNQHFRLLKKPGSCIKKGCFMQILLSLKHSVSLNEVRHNLVDRIMNKATFTLNNRNCSLIKFRLTNS